MNTIYITVENLIATANADAMIVSDNTGYQIVFAFDDDWDAHPLKTAVFVWLKESEYFSQTVAFEGDTVTVPRMPAISSLYVGVMAGDLQTTTPAEIKCHRSILSSGGEEPEAPTESEYAQLMELINATQGASAYELAVHYGYEGTEEEWLASLRGEQGPRGETGADGYTPVKGEDYFTEEEIQAVVERVLDEIPTAEEHSF